MSKYTSKSRKSRKTAKGIKEEQSQFNPSVMSPNFFQNNSTGATDWIGQP